MDYDLFLEKLNSLGLDKDEFIKMVGFKKNILATWGARRNGRKTALWVESWLDLYERNVELENRFEKLSVKYAEIVASEKEV